MVTPEAPDEDRAVQRADLRNRPVVLESGAADRPPRRRRRPWPRTVFGIGAAGVLAAAGVVAGSWSIMSAVGTTTPPGNNAPLWFSPPAPVATTPDADPPPVKGTPKGGSTSGPGSESGSESASGSGEVEPGRHHGESGSPTSTTAHRSTAPPASVAVTVTPTDDHRGKDTPPSEDEDGHPGRNSDGS